MTILNKLTDVTYQNEIYGKLNAYDTRDTLYYRSVYIEGENINVAYDNPYSPLIQAYTVDFRHMPDDTVLIIVKQSDYNERDFTDFILADSAGETLATVQSTECPICSMFVNDDIITMRKLCYSLNIGLLIISADDIVNTMRRLYEYDIIDKGTDIITLLPPEESATDE